MCEWMGRQRSLLLLSADSTRPEFTLCVAYTIPTIMQPTAVHTAVIWQRPTVPVVYSFLTAATRP